MPRWIWIVLALVVLGVGFRAALPVALERAIPWLARDQGVRAEVGNIDLALVAGEILVQDLRVGELPPPDAGEGAADPTDLLHLARFWIAWDWTDLLDRRVHIPVVELDGAQVQLTQRADGSFLLPGPPDAEDEAEPADSTPTGDEVAAGDGTPNDDAPTENAADEDPGWDVAVARFALTGVELSIYDEGRDREVASLTTSKLAFVGLSLGAGGIGLQDLEISEPDLEVDDEWLLAPAPAAAEEAPSDPGAPPSLVVERFALNSGVFQVRTAKGPLGVAIRLEVSDVDTTPDHTFPLELELELGDGRMSLSGQLGLFPLSYEGKLVWSDLGVPPYLLLTNPEIVPWLASAHASGDMQVNFHSEGRDRPAGLRVEGQSDVTNLVFRDPESDELSVKIDRVEITLDESEIPLAPTAEHPRRMAIARVALIAPDILVTNPPDAVDRLVAVYARAPVEGEEPATEEPEADPVAALDLRIDLVEVRKARVRFVDRTVTPTHETRLRDFHVDAKGVRTDPIGIQSLDVGGLVQDRGTISVRGSLPDGTGRLLVDLEQLDLVSYDPFARRAGWEIKSGRTSLESSVDVGTNRYASVNEIVLHDLRVDSDDPSGFSNTFGVSVDFALALLRGPNGDIKLKVPVDWDEHGLGLGVGTVVRDALSAALVGALSSPLKLVGGLVQGDDDAASVEPIPAEVGTAVLPKAGRKRIDQLAKLLTSRPSLRVELYGQTSPEDERALAFAVLQEKASAGDSMPDVEDNGLFARRRVAAALVARADGEPGPLDPEDEALLERYVEAVVVPPERAEALARQRSEAVRAGLLESGVPVQAVSIESARSGAAPGVALELNFRQPGSAPESAEPS